MSGREQSAVGVGVLGASGYIGAELLRYLSVHPRAEVRWATAQARAGDTIADVLPNLRGFVEGEFCEQEEAEARMHEVGCVFVSLPHNQSQEIIPRLLQSYPDVVFIDMAGDFRADDPAEYEKYYRREHAAPEWLPRFVYGFTEFRRRDLDGARMIANPGCFATGLLLVLAPLARSNRLDGDVFVTGVTGSSGSGNKPSRTTHHPERAANFRSYKPLVHQHLWEVEQFLATLTDRRCRLQFVPQSAPLVRGIFITAFVPAMGPNELLELYGAAYGDEPLIGVVEGSPELRWVQGTPRAFVGAAGEPERGGVAFSVSDNLGKGAAGQAIQNFNRSFGFPETEGLSWPGGYV